jgi:hypothetical protein
VTGVDLLSPLAKMRHERSPTEAIISLFCYCSRTLILGDLLGYIVQEASLILRGSIQLTGAREHPDPLLRKARQGFLVFTAFGSACT